MLTVAQIRISRDASSLETDAAPDGGASKSSSSTRLGRLVSPPGDTGLSPQKSRCLFIWNTLMAAFHTAFFLVVLLVGNRDLSVPIYKTDLNFTERAENETDPSVPAWTLVPEYVFLTDLLLTWLVSSFFALSALAHFGNAFLWRSFYDRGISQCRTPSRFVEYFFSASVMIVVLSYQVGVREYGLLLALAGLIAATMSHGYLVELVARPVSEEEWERSLSERLAGYWLGWIPQLLAWGIIAVSFYDQDYSSAPNPPPYFVYIILWGEAALFASFGFVMLWQQCNPPKRYYLGELAYQTLSLVSKGFLGVVMLSSVLMLGSFEESLTSA